MHRSRKALYQQALVNVDGLQNNQHHMWTTLWILWKTQPDSMKKLWILWITLWISVDIPVDTGGYAVEEV